MVPNNRVIEKFRFGISKNLKTRVRVDYSFTLVTSPDF
ncbi:hypothetical protein C943_01702 [Mariniradius saccharolyticus AK6]|uniref:Uncharacterized protein n=1 Tax=Mariniradius saccharolyticus AK6 TaxID=1239962 RepID=M7XU08_9BACT|nr:hypothetical protein C943_01702 [Mariniradius saccharolyticus AK6]